MLSILIPVYNFDVRGLIRELSSQVIAENIIFEIIIVDDCSEENFKTLNRQCNELINIKIIELPVNTGRAKIRNKLAETAKFPYLLFIDCDSMVCDKFYIRNYLKNINESKVICGGRVYSQSAPDDKNLYLRWLYGVNREIHSAKARNLNPNNSFMTNNFIISKELFTTLKFDENITTYGHEDTLFGIELKNQNVIINHIDNPLIHIGLETADEFIKKSKEGIENLLYICNYYKDTNQLTGSVKLLKYARIVNRLFLRGVIKFLFIIFEKQLLKNLKSHKPYLAVFDFYKLGYLLMKE